MKQIAAFAALPKGARPVTNEDRGDALSVCYRYRDRDQRREFGRTLARYVRGHRVRWNIATFLAVLELLGPDVDEIGLTLLCEPTGRLSVTIGYQLAPLCSVDQSAADQSAAAQ